MSLFFRARRKLWTGALSVAVVSAAMARREEDELQHAGAVRNGLMRDETGSLEGNLVKGIAGYWKDTLNYAKDAKDAAGSVNPDSINPSSTTNHSLNSLNTSPPVSYSEHIFPASFSQPEHPHSHPHNIAKSIQSTFLINVEIPVKGRFGKEEFKHGTGTGFLISSHGHLLTNAHVVSPDCHSVKEAAWGLDTKKTGKITVQDNKGRKFAAQIVAYDSLSDLAVLKITHEISELSDHPPAVFHPLPFAPLPATSDIEEDFEIEPGTQVCTIGNPRGLAYSITSGILGSYPRPAQVLGKSDPAIDFLQTDAQVRKGNSGGPLLSLRTGHVLGVTTTSYDPTHASAGGTDLATFAIRVDATVRCLLRNMLLSPPPSTSHLIPPPPRPYLGLHTLDDSLLSSLPERYEGWNGTLNGVLVMSVDPHGPAAKGGIKEGDLIIRVAGERVQSEKGVYDQIFGFSPVCGDIWSRPLTSTDRKFSKVEVTVLRLIEGRPGEVKCVVEAVEVASGGAEREGRVRWLASQGEL